MAGLRHDNEAEVFVVAVPPSHLLRAVELVVVLVDLAGLLVKDLSVGKVNLLDPLQLGPYPVLLVVVAHVYKDVKISAKQIRE